LKGLQVKRFQVGGIVSSANKPGKNVTTSVNADSKEEAEQKGKRKLQNQNPNGHVTVGKVEEKGEIVEPDPTRFWFF
jgi:hypothetical protein